MDAESMMKECVRVGFLEARDLLVRGKRLLPKTFGTCFAQRATMRIPILFDLSHCIYEEWGHCFPLFLREHGDIHLAAPAVDRLRHSFGLR